MPGTVQTIIENRAFLIGANRTPNYSLIQTPSPDEVAPSAWFDVRRFRDFSVSIDIASYTGTTPSLSAWMQAAAQDWTNEPDPDSWVGYDLPFDKLTIGTDTAADVAATLTRRNIVDAAAAPGRWGAVYRRSGAQFVRLRWKITGTFAAGEGAMVSASLFVK